ncbi:hypothetical protein F5Y19DRAFT_473591 [Xylariaceae sp. FL1651]|nr:hypothetical protein F5Y19DRAFT_473591 [Xylariaceae sp. FL1651]
MATTPLPTLPATWSPPSSCLDSTAIYIITQQVRPEIFIYADLFGVAVPWEIQPTPTGPCVPPSYAPKVAYITDGGCPSAYSEACWQDDVSTRSMLCCPSGSFVFQCRPADSSPLSCRYVAQGNEVWSGSGTDFGVSPPTGQPTVRSPTSGEILFAWGIRMLSVDDSSLNFDIDLTVDIFDFYYHHQLPTTSATDNVPPTPPPSSGLSNNAKVGVAVTAVLLIGFIAWVIYYRFQRQKAGPSPATPLNVLDPPHDEETNSKPPNSFPVELHGQYTRGPVFPRHEMPAVQLSPW